MRVYHDSVTSVCIEETFNFGSIVSKFNRDPKTKLFETCGNPIINRRLRANVILILFLFSYYNGAFATNVSVLSSSWILRKTVPLRGFENKRLITNNHIKEILNLEKITKESSTLLRKLSDDLNKHVRCLKTLGHPIDTWDTLIIQIVVAKLDHVTLKEWEQFPIDGEYPTLAELLAFFKKRCELLEAIKNSEVWNTPRYKIC
ncbi:hypothetical protein NQ317_016668 [Molorchus minor]|uniref:Uncharacterized protein n=1 Tax=Molorchus minor TaxID=1323400 RepID=A0ABQ9JP26_9CUCU|nr:hypothetical protein NQ317_016668 [Molorchus minor]